MASSKKYFTDHASFVDHLCSLCFVFVMYSSLLVVALWSSGGKKLTTWLLCM